MAYIPTRPLVADDPLAYFAALTATKVAAKPTPPAVPAARALDLMFGYYQAD